MAANISADMKGWITRRQATAKRPMATMPRTFSTSLSVAMVEILPLPALSTVPNFIKDLRFTNQCGYFGRSPYAFHVVAVSLAEVIDVAVDEVTLLAIEAFPRLLVHSGKDVVPGPGIAADIVGLGIQFGQRYLGV